MSAGNGATPPVPPQPDAPQERVRITISLMADGSILLMAPHEDKILCLGMLNIAQEMVLERHRQNDRENKIKPVRRFL